jgi:hypothetical protein|nr:MAG TPA: hypothetical protein [Caudoviricetes sp.]
MKKIELTEKEIEVIRQQLNGEIEVHSATEEQQQLLMGVIDKANDLLDEEDAYEELEAQGNDLIDWYWKKYQAQENA